MTYENSKVSNLEEVIELITSEKFDKTNFHCLASGVPEKCLGQPCILGVDEAGRGPVLGPMVYAVSYCRATEKDIIKTIGCTDSKALTEKKREDIFGLINSHNDDIGWAVDIISPNYISNKMLKRIKYSLNEIAQNSTVKLIESILEKNVNVTEIFVDTVGPPEKYQEKLSQLFPQCKITVEKKADSLYPVVGAASICAKVIRDTVVQHWKFPELIDVPENDFGTGYPGDPKSKQFLLDSRDDIFGFPNLVRFSWSTAYNLLGEITQVEWEDETTSNSSDDSKISSFFKSLEQSGQVKHTSNCQYQCAHINNDSTETPVPLLVGSHLSEHQSLSANLFLPITNDLAGGGFTWRKACENGLCQFFANMEAKGLL